MSTTEIVLLDRSIIIAHFRREQALAERLKSATLYIPLPVLGELHYGAFKSEHQAKTLKQVHEFLRICPSYYLTRPLRSITAASRLIWNAWAPEFPRTTCGSLRWRRSISCRWSPAINTSR